MRRYDIVIIGNYTKDTIVSPTGTRIVDGGGFNYGAHVAAMLGLRTAAVTRLAKEDSHVINSLLQIGVDVFPTYTKYSTEMRLYYPDSNLDKRILSVTHTAGSFVPAQVQPLEAKAFLINASVRGEVGLDVIKEIKKKQSVLAADMQGFIRIISADGTLVNSDWQKKKQVISQLDILKADAVEAEALTGENNLKTAAKLLASWGASEVVLTHKNGLLVYADNDYYEAKFYPEALIGRSGRGDTCIASYVAKRLNGTAENATIWAAAVTSLKMEAEGPIKRTTAEVENLIQKKYHVSQAPQKFSGEQKVPVI